MAVTVPAAPTPPSPPSVPQVTLGGGGSVQESTVPQSGHQTGDERQEAQARQAVARGDGALSKTTQEKPQAKQGAQNGQQNQNAQAANTTVKTDPQVTAAMQDSGQQEGQAQTPAQQQTGVPAPLPSSPDGHGAGYWAFTFAAVFVLAFVLFRLMIKKRSGKRGELSAEDIRRAAEPEDGDFPVNLRGLTPDEALRRLEEQEAADAAAEIHKARAEAKARFQRAQRKFQPDVPAAAPKQAAREYREQVTAMLPKERVKPEKIVRQPPKNPEDKEHFEISV